MDESRIETGRRRQRVWLGSPIPFLGQTGTQVTITAWSTLLSSFPPSLFLFAFILPCFPLSFLFPPCRPHAGIFHSIVLLRPCGRCLFFLSTYAFRLAAFLISLRHLYFVLFQNLFLILFYFCFFLVLLVSISSRTRSTCISLAWLTLKFCNYF